MHTHAGRSGGLRARGALHRLFTAGSCAAVQQHTHQLTAALAARSDRLTKGERPAAPLGLAGPVGAWWQR
jgi:hypothetical protein